MERTTFFSKFFATALSVALAMFMFAPAEAWATGSSTEFDTLPTEQTTTGNEQVSQGTSASSSADESDNATDAGSSSSGDSATGGTSEDGDASDGTDDGLGNADGNVTPSAPDSILAAADSSSAATSTWKGNGTATAPYEIATAADLVALAEQVAVGENFAGDYFALTADIDLSKNAPWTPIGSGASSTPDVPAPPTTDETDSSSAKAVASHALLRGLSSITPDPADDATDEGADDTPANDANDATDGSTTDSPDTTDTADEATDDADDADDLVESTVTTPIAPYAPGATPFAGNFDGGNHAISGLTIKDASGSQLGLFGTLSGAKIENLTLKNVAINSTSSTDVGALAGTMTDNTTIFKVRVASGAVTGQSAVGGIVGSVMGSGTISNCSNNASVAAVDGNAGGIAGAVAGRTSTASMDISTCENTGTVSVSGTGDTEGGFGGIVGSATNAVNVTTCINSAPVTAASSPAGGIVGVIEDSTGSSSPTITGCRNGDKANISGGKNGIAGGIVGSVIEAATITKNINTAAAITGDNYAAGLVGLFHKVTSPDFSVTKNVSTTPVASLSATNKGQYVNLDNAEASDKGIDISGNVSEAPASFNSVPYATLQYAIDAATAAQTAGTTAQTVKLLTNVVETVTVPSDGVIALDLGGKSISQAAETDNAPVTVLGSLTLSASGTIGTEDAKADDPNKVGVLVNGATAKLTVNAGLVAGSESAVALTAGGSFTMEGTTTGELRSGAAGIDIYDSANTTKSASTTEEDASAIAAFASFMSGFFAPQGELSPLAANSKVTLSGGEIVGSPVIKVAEGVTPDYAITGGWYSTAMPSSYVANGYHPTLAVNDTETPYTVSNATVTYTFQSNDGSAVAPIEVPYGTTPTPRTMPTSVREGYYLEGWYVNPDFMGEPTLDLPEVATENTTYYAKWISGTNPAGGMAKAGDSSPILLLLGVGAAIGIALAFSLRTRKLQNDALNAILNDEE